VSMTSAVQGVILAGGQGSRMGALGEQYPKALLPIGNEPVIVHQLRLLESLGVRDVKVVVGHRAEDFARVIGNGSAYGVHVEFIDQGPRLGSAHALGRARAQLHDRFILLLGDYYFVPSEPERMLRRLADGASAIAVKRAASAATSGGCTTRTSRSTNRWIWGLNASSAPVTDMIRITRPATTPASRQTPSRSCSSRGRNLCATCSGSTFR